MDIKALIPLKPIYTKLKCAKSTSDAPTSDRVSSPVMFGRSTCHNVKFILGAVLAVLAITFIFLTLHRRQLPSSTTVQALFVTMAGSKESNSDSNNTLDIDKNTLYFNRVPKTGSENMAFLLDGLSLHNNFTHARFPSPVKRQLTLSEQSGHLHKILRYPRPLAYDRHVYFMDFPSVSEGLRTPIWFSIIREPGAKFVSRYFYARDHPGPSFKKLLKRGVPYALNTTAEEWRAKGLDDCVLKRDPECTLVPGNQYDLIVPYFCGHSDECMRLNSRSALAQAKRNIERYYPVVGILEQFDDTLKLLEKKIPKYFNGVYKLYKEDLNSPHRNKGSHTKRGISIDAIKVLVESMPLEYELYFFVKDRFQKQLREAALT